MNSPAYRKAYMANLKLETANNAKILKANKGQPATNQYIQNSGQSVIGASNFTYETNVQARGVRVKERK